MITRFYNCWILRDHQFIKEDLWARDGIILDPTDVFWDERVRADVNIDVNGLRIIPGLIDVQINGGFGIDFSIAVDNISEGVARVAKNLLSHGVTGFCPTLVSSSKDVYRKVIPAIKPTPGGAHGAEVLGIHLEGPFISKEKKGAHNPEHLREIPNGMESILETYGTLENVKVVTLAPELDTDFLVTKELNKKGIAVSLGHSVASISTGENAMAHGATMVTHLFNAMHTFHHRDPGVIGLIAGKDHIFYGLIADNIHTHPAALRIAQRTMPQGAVLVTDAVAAMGLKDGTYTIGDQRVTVKGYKATIEGTNILSGSAAPLHVCLKNYLDATSCSLPEAVEAATLHPAQVLKMEHIRGTLNFGAQADFVVLGDDLSILQTYIKGEKVYPYSS